ncbi:MAG: hypothetical protein DMH00_06150 [Acidobacteria bacterium]|nr:MAG: hypothetical protein DMH00_06150 [Acidobacteriota bacterium]
MLLATGFLLVWTDSPAVLARVYLTQDEALKGAFPSPARAERKTLFLDEAQAGAIEKEAGSKLGSRVFSYYVGRGADGLLGYAYFDTHLVRTLPETIMVLLGPDGKIKRVEVLSFSEDLALHRGIRNLTGASLTAEAITAACRRILALHRRVGGGKE